MGVFLKAAFFLRNHTLYSQYIHQNGNPRFRLPVFSAYAYAPVASSELNGMIIKKRLSSLT